MSAKEMTQPDSFVGWWEAVFYVKGGVHQDVVGIIERIYPDGRFEVYLNQKKIGGGRHEDFRSQPTGFTNVQEMENTFGVSGKELVIYRLRGDLLEVCKAPESSGRPIKFESTTGSQTVHAAIRRIQNDDPRIPDGLE
ncbi:MAG: hypothetical protein ACWA5Q_11835 [bacterium]